MKVGVLPVGSVLPEVLGRIQEAVAEVFPTTDCAVVDECLALPPNAFNMNRRQYHSEGILREIQRYAAAYKGLDRVLGVVDVDMFVEGLNFAFGEATCPGKAALISLWRLRPEFYGAAADGEVFLERTVKEAVHELAHTLGLGHCRNAACVMFFSNSIADTDRKQRLFCGRCSQLVASAVSHLEGIC
jgi:archaemetzincin